MNNTSKRFLKLKKQQKLRKSKKIKKISQSAGTRSQRSSYSSHTSSRYSRPQWSRQSTRLTNRSTKLHQNKTSTAIQVQQSNYRYIQFVEQTKLVKQQLEKLKEKNYQDLDIDKSNLLNAWDVGVKSWKKDKFKSVKYFILAALVSSILLNRHGALKKAMKISTSLHDSQAHLLMRGITDMSQRDGVKYHKSKLKEIIDKAGGLVKFIGYLQNLTTPKKMLINNYEKLLNLDKKSVGEAFDIIYTSQNPYLHFLINQFANSVTS